MNDSKIYWVGFNLVKGIGPKRLQVLLNAFGDIERAWLANESALESTGLSPKLVAAICQVRDGDRLGKIWEYIQEQDITVLTWDDPEYPRRLKEVDSSPPVLYIRGTLLGEDQWAFGIVGTRRSTTYGRQVAKQLAGDLARSGVTVVSGLARGIDGVAHRAALDGGGRTIAILGSGVDRIYPPEHRNLAAQIIENGAIISDYPPGTAPEAANFPPRNRIISGIVQAVAVIEAGSKSGALITAAFAAEQGREVFAVPGNIFAPQSKGTNLLIKEGAHILLDTQELLEMLNMAQVGRQRIARTVLPTDPTEAQLFELMGQEPLHIDDIRSQTDLPIEQVSSVLTIMELKGMVRQVGPMSYMAVYEDRADYNVIDDDQ